MKKLYLFCCVLSLICPLMDIYQEKAEGCTIGVASGKATADGRPLLWKSRVGSGRDYKVVYCKDGRFKHLVMAPDGDSQSNGGGVNEFGFCIVYSAAFDLLETSKKGGMDGGHIMKMALQQCITVDDLENILKQSNVSGRTSTCNIGVIDAFGGAAIFETGNFSYARFDATDTKVAPQGYIVRTCFTITGGGDVGKVQYDRTNQLWQQAIEKGQLDYRYVLRGVSRDLSGSEETFCTKSEAELTKNNTLRVLKNYNTLSRPDTTYVMLFHGVERDENPSLTTFWAILGNPILSVAVPSWVIAESTASELDSEEFSPICATSNDLFWANYVTADKRTLLLNPEMLSDIWAITYAAEDRICDQTDSVMAQWRQDYPTAQEVVSFHRSMTTEAMSSFEETTVMLMRKGGPTANLRIALHMRSSDKAKTFIEEGANVNVSDGHGYTPLHYAVQNNLKEIVELLLSKNTAVNAKTVIGKTPLDIAIEQHQEDILELLVANGAKPSSIFTAARMGDAARVRAFLAKGVDVNAKGPEGRTVLHIASREGHKDVVEVLLAHGADVNAGAYSGRTAAEFALVRGYAEIVEQLVAGGADVPRLHLAICAKDEAKVRSLIEDGTDVNKHTKPYGFTPLLIAVEMDLKEIAELLITKGADVNAKDVWYWTPLHSAAYRGTNIVSLLLTNGANVNAMDGSGSTPLGWAIARGHSEIVQILRKHGAK